jgi:hypothetical protein
VKKIFNILRTTGRFYPHANFCVDDLWENLAYRKCYHMLIILVCKLSLFWPPTLPFSPAYIRLNHHPPPPFWP